MEKRMGKGRLIVLEFTDRKHTHNYKTNKSKASLKIYIGRPRPLPAPWLSPPLRGFFIVSSTDKIKHAASEAAVSALIFTTAGSHTQASKLSAISSWRMFTPNQVPPVNNTIIDQRLKGQSLNTQLLNSKLTFPWNNPLFSHMYAHPTAINTSMARKQYYLRMNLWSSNLYSSNK